MSNKQDEIRQMFLDHYRNNYDRFARMYDNTITTIDGTNVKYEDMIPQHIRKEIVNRS